MQRDEFVAALISALEENEKQQQQQVTSDGAESDDSVSFVSMGLRSEGKRSFGVIQQVYDALQFDFPQVSEADLMRLAEFFQHLSSATSEARYSSAQKEQQQQDVSDRFRITNKLVEALEFLNDHPVNLTAANDDDDDTHKTKTKTTRSPKSAAFLAGSVLLSHVARLLQLEGDHLLAKALDGILVPNELNDKRQDRGINDTVSKQIADDYGTKQVTSALSALGENGATPETGFVDEVFALEEDPDDLSLVYEGALPSHSQHSLPGSVATISIPVITSSHYDNVELVYKKLRFLSQVTCSSLLSSISPEEWQHWRFTSSIKSIVLYWLHNQHRFQLHQNGISNGNGNTSGSPSTRYLYLLRDRIMLFPTQSASILQELVGLIIWLQNQLKTCRDGRTNGNKYDGAGTNQTSGDSSITTSTTEENGWLGCLLLVYSILAECSVSKHFATNGIAQKHLVAALESLLPTLSWQLHSFSTKQQQQQAPIRRPSTQVPAQDVQDQEDQEDQLLLLFLLQMSHFFVRFHGNPRLAVQKLQEMGILRSFLLICFANTQLKTLIEGPSLIPNATTTSTTTKRAVSLAEPEAEDSVVSTIPLWCATLLRLFTQSSLVYADFAVFLSRVPKMQLMFAHEQIGALFGHEKLLWLVALQLHNAGTAAACSATAPEIQHHKAQIQQLMTHLFPMECDSLASSKQKAQHALYVMQSLNQPQVMQHLVARSNIGTCLLQQVESCYGKLGGAFQCELSDTKATHEQEDHENSHEKNHQDTTQQLVVLRDQLRKAMKPLVAAKNHTVPFHEIKLD